MFTYFLFFFFFFSSRRRHTRSLCDWSSDVCSSDLLAFFIPAISSSSFPPTINASQNNCGARPCGFLWDRRLPALYPGFRLPRCTISLPMPILMKPSLLLLIAAPLLLAQPRSISDAEVMKVHRSAL